MRPELLALGLLVVVVGALGAPSSSDNGALGAPSTKVVQSLSTSDGLGNYEFWYQLSDETYRWETGTVKTGSDGKQYVAKSGGYRYYDVARGITYMIQFEADENGYRPKYTELPPEAGAPPRLVIGAGGG